MLFGPQHLFTAKSTEQGDQQGQERGQQNSGQDIHWHCRAVLQPQGGDCGGEKLDRSGVEQYKEDHRVARSIALRPGRLLLERFHCGDAQGSGGVAKPEKIRGDIH